MYLSSKVPQCCLGNQKEHVMKIRKDKKLQLNSLFPSGSLRQVAVSMLFWEIDNF